MTLATTTRNAPSTTTRLTTKTTTFPLVTVTFGHPALLPVLLAVLVLVAVAVAVVDKERTRLLAKTQTPQTPPPPPPPALLPQSRLLTRLLPVLRETLRKSPPRRRRQHRRRLRARESATRERNLNLSCPRRCRQAVEGRLEESTWSAPLATITRKGTLVLVAAEVISMRGGKLSVVGFSMKGGKPSSRFNGFIGALPYEETLARR
mmetsp:Transcript_60988/g.119579  ORF Transcript_60988/g.119579 Transcript_60988/m.119579 type:complete len:206 (+) Transcript_60988:1599-2216(+)